MFAELHFHNKFKFGGEFSPRYLFRKLVSELQEKRKSKRHLPRYMDCENIRLTFATFLLVNYLFTPEQMRLKQGRLVSYFQDWFKNLIKLRTYWFNQVLHQELIYFLGTIKSGMRLSMTKESNVNILPLSYSRNFYQDTLFFFPKGAKRKRKKNVTLLLFLRNIVSITKSRWVIQTEA